MNDIEIYDIISCVGVGLMSVFNYDGILVHNSTKQVVILSFHSIETIVLIEYCSVVSVLRYGILINIAYRKTTRIGNYN